jgi:hypothetical protein
MKRGEVYLAPIALPNRDPKVSSEGLARRSKLLVVLQEGQIVAGSTEVAVVLVSTYRGSGKPRPFEVLVGTNDGFDHLSVIDGRWPYTVRRSMLEAGRCITTLTPVTMHDVSIAIYRGLQLQ